MPSHPPHEGPPWSSTWAFVLEPIGDRATRLLVRVRGAMEPGIATRLAKPLILAVHEAMERRQLRNLRERVEEAFGAGMPAAAG